MRPTRFGFNGLVFYGTMLAAFYAAPYSNLFFLLLGFMTLLGAGSILAGWRNLARVAGRLAELRPVPAGEPVGVGLELTAPGPPRYQLAARLRLADGIELTGRLDLLAGREVLMLRSAALPRGCHAVERATLESTHPFGFFRLTRAIEVADELVVYPSPTELLHGRSASQALDELLGRSQPGAGTLQPTGLRDHRQGDGLRRIHWRASARRARLVVLEWEGGSGHGLEVVLDRRCEPAELEEALGILSALIQLARKGKETLRIHSQDLSTTFGAGHRPWTEALRFLALAGCVAPEGPPPPATSPAVLRLPRPNDARRVHA